MAMKRSVLLVAAVLVVGAFATPASASGTGWSITPSPNPKVPTGQLFRESCTAATSCTAVGTYVKASGVGVTLAEHWNGSTWRIQPTPNPRGAAVSSLSGVSCTAPSACTAVGNSVTRAGESQPLAERWDGTRWRIQPATNPKQGGGVLSGVACMSASSCIAVGASNAFTPNARTLAERWNGKRWSIQATPNPKQGGGSLISVACTSVSSCTTVGVSNAGTLAERWNGTRWRIQPTPTPAGAQFAPLNTVACPSPSACSAAGFSSDRSGIPQTLAERWNGGRWRIQPTPNPAGAAPSQLGSVSCTSPSACTATGEAANLPLAERWDGAKWRIQPTPSLRAGGGLASVSCTSAVACAAVGARTDSSGDFTGTLAERWDGSRWRLQPTPNPPGAQ